jgi:hypothetical protein
MSTYELLSVRMQKLFEHSLTFPRFYRLYIMHDKKFYRSVYLASCLKTQCYVQLVMLKCAAVITDKVKK